MGRRASTRGEAAGMKPARAAKQLAKFIERTTAAAQQIAYDWQDVDNLVISLTDELLGHVEYFEKAVKECIERLKEPLEQEPD